MEVEIGRGKKAREGYGFDDVAIVPSRRTRDPQDVDIGWKLGPHLLELPLIGAAMDGVVSPKIAIELGRLGGLGLLNLERIFTRYQNAEAAELAELDRGRGRHHAVHRGAEQRELEQVRPELPADVDVLRVARTAARDDCDVVEPVRAARLLPSADLYLHDLTPLMHKGPGASWSPGPARPSPRCALK